MKENDKLDKWLRESLENYQPKIAENSRDRFLNEAAEFTKNSISSDTTSHNGRIYTIIALALLLTVSGLVYWQRSGQQVITNSQLSVKNIKEPTKSNVNTQFPENNRSESSAENKDYRLLQKKGIPQSSLVGKPEFSADNSSPLSEENKTPQFAQVNSTSQSSQVNSTSQSSQFDNISQSSGDDSIVQVNPDFQDGGIQESPKDEPDKKDKQLDNRLYRNTLSIYYRPEVVWNVIGNEKNIHNFGIECNTRIFNGNYLFGTGLGVSLTKGYYEYAIEYNEYLGNYNRLDSISFNWDAQRFMMEQTVHTSSQEVFDTAVTTEYARLDRKFIYLQIPVTLGYDILNTNNNTLGLRFAPILSVLLSKKPVDFRYEAGNNKIVQINRITPDRVKTNWQLNAGICYGRRLGESLWLEIEPRFSYYFNSVYEKSDNSYSPMGASIRVAMGIKY